MLYVICTMQFDYINEQNKKRLKKEKEKKIYRWH